MQITVAGKQVDLSDALRTRVSTQMDTIASKYFDHALEAHVTFSRARSFFTCDINVHAGRGLQLRGEGEAADANIIRDVNIFFIVNINIFFLIKPLILNWWLL